MNSVQTIDGSVLPLGRKIGSGGEGDVYLSESDHTLAIKLYHPHIAPQREKKIKALIEYCAAEAASQIAYPRQVTIDQSGKFRGFTLQLVQNGSDVHKLYRPEDRYVTFPQANFPFLVKTCTNIADAVSAAHRKNIILGDINERSVLVRQDASIVLIDCDSFQFSYREDIYRCKVAVREFTPPELQHEERADVLRNINHDCFGLAVLIFHILFLGRHPFAGKSAGVEDIQIAKAITEFRFPYSADTVRTQMAPPPNLPTLRDLPPSMAIAFETAFGPEGPLKGRPSAHDWARLLQQAEGQIVQCSARASHQFFRAAPSCPWCRVERATPGFQVFPRSRSFPNVRLSPVKAPVPPQLPQQPAQPFVGKAYLAAIGRGLAVAGQATGRIVGLTILFSLGLLVRAVLGIAAAVSSAVGNLIWQTLVGLARPALSLAVLGVLLLFGWLVVQRVGPMILPPDTTRPPVVPVQPAPIPGPTEATRGSPPPRPGPSPVVDISQWTFAAQDELGRLDSARGALLKRIRDYGYGGISESVEACYARVAVTRARDRYQYCYFLDKLAAIFAAANDKRQVEQFGAFFALGRPERRVSEALDAYGLPEASRSAVARLWISEFEKVKRVLDTRR